MNGHTHGAQRCVTGLALCTLLSSIACADVTPRSGSVTIDTVAGVIHVRNSGTVAGSAWSIGPVTTIGGGLEADEAYSFGRIAGITVLDGRTYVADGQTRDIRAFDGDGRLLFRFGRSGEGPGEFAAIDALAHAPDGTLLARDPRLFRVTRFDAEGRYLADYRLVRPWTQFSSDGTGFRVGRDGWLYDRLTLTLGIASTDSLAIIAYDDTGVVRDTILVAETAPRYVTVVENAVPMGGLDVPFAASATAAVGPDGRIARALGATFAFDVLSPAGLTLRAVDLDARPVPVSAVERDSALAVMRRQAAEMTDGQGRISDFEFPDIKAAVTHLLSDEDGCWWLGANLSARRMDAPPHFEIFDPDGAHIARLAVPFRPIEIGHDYIVGVATDESGIEVVARAPLERGS